MLEAGDADGVELGQHLWNRLHARPAAEDGDDVAELTEERAAAGELQRGHRIARRLDDVVARRRHRLHVGLLRLLVAIERLLPARQGVEELRPGFLGLADEANVAKVDELGFGHGDIGTADDNGRVHLPELEQDLTHPCRLDHHAGDADDIEAIEVFEVDRLDVLVHHLDGAMRGGKRGERRKRASHHPATLVAGLEGENVIVAVISRLEARIDDADRERTRLPVFAGRILFRGGFFPARRGGRAAFHLHRHDGSPLHNLTCVDHML